MRSMPCRPEVCSPMRIVWPRAFSCSISSGREAPRFQLGRAVAAAEVRQRDRLLHVEAPVEGADQDLRHVVDDQRAARRADRLDEAPGLLVEHDGRAHRAARALARLDAVGDRAAGVDRIEGEVGQLVVEDEAVDHLARAEGILDAGGHGQPGAVLVDGDDVRRRMGFDRIVQAPVPGGLHARRMAGIGLAHRARADEAGALAR
jgi:hypothetical protein